MYLMAGINQRTNRVKSKDDVVAVRGGGDGKRKMFMALSVYDWLIGNLPCFYQTGGLYSMIESGLESSIVNEVC